MICRRCKIEKPDNGGRLMCADCFAELKEATAKAIATAKEKQINPAMAHKKSGCGCGK